MKKTNTQKGITLIALIITIVVLLILAVVAIRAVQGDGIITKAKEARSKTEQAQADEEKQLMQYEYEIAKAQGQTEGTINAYLMEKEIKEVYGQEIKIGDKVDYKGIEIDYSGEWKVLGIENRQLLLVSTTNVIDSYKISNDDTGWDDTQRRFLGFENQLDISCEIYGTGIGATGARSIKVEDINKITGYDPTCTGDGKPFGAGTINQYDNVVTYKIKKDESGNPTGIDYTSKLESGSSTDSEFRMPDGVCLDTIEDGPSKTSIEIKNAKYQYYPDTLTTNQIGETKGISKVSPAYNMLFNSEYWLASSGAYGFNGYAACFMFNVSIDNVNYNELWYSNSSDFQEYFTTQNDTFGVRAVVYLNSNCNLIFNGDTWIIS